MPQPRPATPGTVMGHLERRVGDFAPAGGGKRKGGGGGSAIGMMGGASKLLIELAKGNGTIDDPTIRQDLVRLHTMGEIGRYTNLRVKAAKEAGVEAPPAVGEHRQALDEQHDAAPAGPQPADRRRAGHVPRLRRLEARRADRCGGKPVPADDHRARRCSRRRHRSTAAPTRCSATSSASASSGSPRSRATTASPRSRTCPKNG